MFCIVLNFVLLYRIVSYFIHIDNVIYEKTLKGMKR